MANTSANVSTGKPLAAGGIWTGPTTATKPTDASTALTGFKALGYVSEDGLVNTIERDVEKIKAWGGDTVLVVTTSRDETFQFTFIETNADVLKEVYGAENVTEDEGALTVVHTNADPDPRVYVFEIALTGGRKKRIVVPNAQISEVGDVSYVDGEPIGYEVTLAALPDAQGNTAYEYISAPA